MKAALRVIGIIGVVLFGFGLVLTFISPVYYEKAARTFLEQKIEQLVSERLDFGGDNRLSDLARSATGRSLMGKREQEVTTPQERLLSSLRMRIATAVTGMQNEGSNSRALLPLGPALASTIIGKLPIMALDQVGPQLNLLIEGK